MVLRFEQLRGAAADVKELEYISALHQTDVQHVRKDASIQAEDVRLYLMSRYGIKVTTEEVRSTIFAGMAGGGGDDECLDLMEVVAILLIPTLIKAAEMTAGEELPTDVIAPPTGLIDYVLHMILHDVTGSSKNPSLSKELVSSILLSYGEEALAADDDLLQEMVDAASTSIETGIRSSVTSGNSTGLKSQLLDESAFAECLTHDVRLYDIKNEVRLTTNLEAVFLKHEIEQKGLVNALDMEGEPRSSFFVSPSIREKLAVGRALEQVPTLAEIDITAETYRSKSLMVLIWASILITLFAYWVGNIKSEDNCSAFEYDRSAPWGDNFYAMTCDAGTSIVSKLFLFGFMSVAGLAIAFFASIGNAMDTKPWKPLIGASVMLLFVLIPYFDSTTGNSGDALLMNASLVLGLTTAAFHVYHFFTLLAAPREQKLSLSIRKWIPRNTMYAEARIKRAAARKLALMTKNALDIVNIKDQNHAIATHYGQALQAFGKHGAKYAPEGGFRWAWKRIIGRKSFSSDGIWIPARFVASNIGQYIVTLYILLYGIYLTRNVLENFDKEEAKKAVRRVVDVAFDAEVDEDLVSGFVANITSTFGTFFKNQESVSYFGCDQMNLTAVQVLEMYCSEPDSTMNETTWQCDQEAPINYLCPMMGSTSLPYDQQMALLHAAGYDEGFLRSTAREALNQAAEQSVNSLYPSEKYMLAIPMVVGTLVAFAVGLYLSLMYIPSVTTTILKLRCGYIPTLRDPNFAQYRAAPDQVAILTGSLFFGTLVSSAVVGGIVGLIIFFFLWQATAYYAQRFVAIAVGVIVVLLIRLCILLSCRCKMYRSFYRQRPGAANLSILALEWANFLLSAGFIFARMIKLLITAGACIGRIDTPFLASGMGRIGPIELDNYPIVHTKDILSHDAHRHPYIEQLGISYLMKLRYVQHFGHRAGSCWRLIFVYALMPWLQKYRIQARPELGEASRAVSDNNAGETPRYPDLHYTSLHNLTRSLKQEYADESKNFDDNYKEDNDERDFPRAGEIQTRRVTFVDSEHSERIRELEEEVKQLKKELENTRDAVMQSPRSIDSAEISIAET